MGRRHKAVSEALAKSLNVPAVEVLERLDPVRFVALLRRGGLKLDFPPGGVPNLSVILGGAGTSLERLVGAYSAFARRGMAGKPRFTQEDAMQETRMMSEGAAFIIRDILESGGPIGRAVETGPGARRGIAWKTGTSFGFRDAWAIGVSNRLSVGVWVGRPDGTPNPGFFGANVAAPLLIDVFDALDGAPPVTRQPPSTVRQARICWPLGTRSSTDNPGLCHVQRTAWALNDAVPPTFPDRLRSGEPRYVYSVGRISGQRVAPGCGQAERTRVDAARWPAILEPWLDDGLRQRALPPPWDDDCLHQPAPEDGIKIAGIADGEVLHRAQGGEPPLLRLAVRGHSSTVLWQINGRIVGQTSAPETLTHRFAEPGRYEITALDEHGRYDRISISVR